MNLRKALSIAAMAFALAVFALPAVASAYTIKDHGETLESTEIPMTGPVSVNTALGSIGCTVHATLYVDIDQVEVPSVEITTETCEGTGVFAGCEVVSDEVEWPSGPVTVNAEDLEVETGTIRAEMSNCPLSELAITSNGKKKWYLAWLGKTGRIFNEIEFGYSPKVDAFGMEIEAEVEGVLEVVAEEEATYEIV